jgi:Flp pilus assembly protein TadB
MTSLRGLAVLTGVAVLLALPVGDVALANMRASPPAQTPRVAMILLDVNHTMAATGIAQERGAALDYAGALPADVRVGLITFSDGWQIALRPATDRGRLTAALSAVGPAGTTSTGVHRAISGAQSAVNALGAAARSRLLVLSDGEHLTASALAPAIPTDVVTWYYPHENNNTPALAALASASGGHVTSPLGAARLAGAFPGAVPAPTPNRTRSAPAQRTPVPARTHQPVPVSPASSPHVRWPWWLPVAVFTGLLLAILLLTGALGSRDRSKRLIDRIDRYSPVRARRHADGEDAVTSPAEGWVTGLLRSSVIEQRLADRLDLAGIARKPAQWVLLDAFACVALALTLSAVTRNGPAGILAGALFGWLGMRLFVSHRIRRRRAAFAEQLPDVLQLVASSLRSGFSLQQSLDAIVRQDTQPAAGEFSRALAKARLGVDLELALDEIASRMDATDLRWTVITIRIQREVGGNLAEVLGTTVETMRERAQLRRQARALSAEGRLSAYILLALPILVGVFLLLTRRSYLRPLYGTPVGLVLLGFAVVMVALGAFWLSKIVKVEA